MEDCRVLIYSPRNDDYRYIIALTPGIKFLEAGIKLDVYSMTRV